MLDDRSYMQGPRLGGRSVTVALIFALVGIYVIQSFLVIWNVQARGWVANYLALSLHGMAHWRLWQLVTFQFLHEAPMPFHVLFNCLGLYFFGQAVEDALGKRGFLGLYFLSGTFGGIVQILSTWLCNLGDPLPLAPTVAGKSLMWLANHHPDAAVLGASAGVIGLVAAYATLFPMREVTLLVLFFPVTMRARYLFWGALALSVAGTVFPYGGIAHGAHLGGILMGWAYIRWGINSTPRFNWHPFQTRERKRELVNAASIKAAPWARPKARSFEDLPAGEFISREVDPILDKISAHGIQSLTPHEKQILEAARAKMEKR